MDQLSEIIRRRDYSSLIDIDINDLKTHTHRIAYTSACLFLGKTELLRKLISKLKKNRQNFWILELMKAYLSIETGYDKRKAIANLVHFKESAQDTPFILGEIYFAIGFLFHQIAEKELSFLFFKNSLQYFKMEKCNTHIWYVYLNLFLAKRSDLDKVEESDQYKYHVINGVEALPGEVQARALWLLSSIYYTDNSIEKALNCLARSIEIAKKYNQKIQEVESYIDLTYFNYKLRPNSRGLKMPVNFLDHRSYYTLEELGKLIKNKNTPFTKSWLNILKNENIHPLFAHRLIDIYLEKAIDEIPPRHFLDTVDFIKYNIIRRPMFIPFYDLDFYSTLGFLKEGDLTNFFVGLQKLEGDLFFRKSPLFKRKYDQLMKEFHKRKKPSEKNIKIELNLINHTLSVNNRSYSTAQTPLIERSFKVLLEKSSTSVSGADFFSYVYSEEYEEIRHDSRLASLISRMRSFLPNSSAIVRRDNQLKLSGFEAVRIIYPKNKNFTRSKRHDKITSHFEKNSEAVTALELHKKLDIPLRTLQLDLKILFNGGDIHKFKKGRKYFYSRN